MTSSAGHGILTKQAGPGRDKEDTVTIKEGMHKCFPGVRVATHGKPINSKPISLNLVPRVSFSQDSRTKPK